MLIEIAMNPEMQKIIISVVVPVYNVSLYLDECLSSLNRQNEQNVEFIIVDDGSTDESSKICDTWAEKDHRFRVIHQKNKGLLLARKTGIMQSRGDWILFVDGDDVLAEDALFQIYKLIQNDSDVIQFNVDILNCNDKLEYHSFISKLKIPENYIILGNYNICFRFYSNNNYILPLWNKIYKRTLLIKVYSYFNISNFTIGEDVITFFVCCYFANSFLAVNSKPLYKYRLNTGITKSNESFYNLFCYVKIVYKIYLMDDFLNIIKSNNIFYLLLLNIKYRFYTDIIIRLSRLSINSLEKIFPFFLKFNKISDFLPLLYKYFFNKQDILAMVASKALQDKHNNNFSSINMQSIMTIGIFYHRYHNGGIERVISLHIPMFLHMGYRVVLFTEQIHPELEYPLPPEVIRVIIPERYDQNRAEIFERSLIAYGVNVLCHHASSSPLLTFDLLLCRSLGIKTVIVCHDAISSSLGLHNPFNKIAVYSLADAVCVTSKNDKIVFGENTNIINSYYLPNPIPADDNLTQILPASEKQPVLLWIGRLNDVQKNFKDALEIFRLVLEFRQEATGYMIGSGEAGEDIYVDQYIKQHNLTNRLFHIPYTTEVSAYYPMGSVLLVTSNYENFPMVIAESKLYGLPLVTYEMQHLELLKDGKGYISVPYHHMKDAAEAIVKIFDDNDYAQKLSDAARESIQFYLNNNIEEDWRILLTHFFDTTTMNLNNIKLSNKSNDCFPYFINRNKIKQYIYIRNSAFNNYLLNNKIRKLQIGSGNNHLEGWFNTDIKINDGIYYLDLKEKFPFPSNIFDYIYSEHNIEHFTINEAVFILNECFYTLKSGGVIRIATPDLNKLISYYYNNTILNDKYTEWEYNSFIRNNCSIDVITKCLVLNNFFRDWGHKVIYDFDTLKSLLEFSGFIHIRKAEISKSNIPDLCGIEQHLKNLPYNFNEIETMVVEATKP